MFHAINRIEIKPKSDGRGKHKPKHAKPQDTLDTFDEHIESFKPSISHYRRARSPLRRYLAPELCLALMYKYYQGGVS